MIRMTAGEQSPREKCSRPYVRHSCRFAARHRYGVGTADKQMCDLMCQQIADDGRNVDAGIFIPEQKVEYDMHPSFLIVFRNRLIRIRHSDDKIYMRLGALPPGKKRVPYPRPQYMHLPFCCLLLSSCFASPAFHSQCHRSFSGLALPFSAYILARPPTDVSR